MKWACVLIILLIVSTSAFALGRYIELRPLNPPETGGDKEVRWGSDDYFSPFVRKPNYIFNFTVDYSKLPWPRIERVVPRGTIQRGFDSVINNTNYSFNPENCPGAIAHCYERLVHDSEEKLPRGSGLRGVSGYTLPEDRIRHFFCVANDTECTSGALSCFCPKELPKKAPFLTRTVDCPLETNVCEVTPSGLMTLCNGNFTYCVNRYEKCGCGKFYGCNAAEEHTCINNRNEMVVCGGVLSNCLTSNKYCFCGKEIQALQLGCTETKNRCWDDGKEATCYGSLGDCAVLHDMCECGT